MIIYNISIKVNKQIHENWLQWQKEEHIPEIMATGLFQKYIFSRLLEQDDSEGPTYVVQYFMDNIESYNLYLSTYAPLLRQKAMKKWGDQFIAFRSVLEAVQ